MYYFIMYIILHGDFDYISVLVRILFDYISVLVIGHILFF